MASPRGNHASPTDKLYDEVAGLVDEERAVDIVYLNFRKASGTVFHKILQEKLLMYGLDEQTLRCT